MPTEHILDINI